VSTPVYSGARYAGPTALQYLPFVACLIALPIFVLGDFPLAGWAVGVGLFAVNFAGAKAIDWIARGKSQVTAVGVSGVGFLSRAWLSFGALFLIAEFGDREVAVAAAITFLAYFTIDLLVRSILHSLARSGSDPTRETA
jgi:hypothetical protein